MMNKHGRDVKAYRANSINAMVTTRCAFAYSIIAHGMAMAAVRQCAESAVARAPLRAGLGSAWRP